MKNIKINHAKAKVIHAEAFLAKTAWTKAAITTVITDADAFAKASDTTIKIVVRWMIRHPAEVANLVTSDVAWRFAVAVLAAAAPRETSAMMDARNIAYYGDDPDTRIRAARRADLATLKDIMDNHDVQFLADEIGRIFWLPDKKDVVAAMV